MKKTALALLALAALTAACHNERPSPPDYDSVRARSQSSQQGLDKENGN